MKKIHKAKDNLSRKLVLLSVAFGFHDSTLALSIDDTIVAVVELERVFRAKRLCASPSLMEMMAERILKDHGLTINDVNYLLVNALNCHLIKTNSQEDLSETACYFMGRRLPTLCFRHHFAHAGLFFLSPFARSLIATCDSGGDLQERVAYFVGDGVKIQRLDIDTAHHCSTTPYGQFARYLYDDYFCVGKMMGLSAYSACASSTLEQVDSIFPLLRNADERSALNILNNAFPDLMGCARHTPLKCAELASAVQQIFENRRSQDISSVFQNEFDNIVLAGGSGLNLGCNTLLYHTVSKHLWIPPSCDDTGIAVGQCCISIANLLNVRPCCTIPYCGITESKKDREILRRSLSDQLLFEGDPAAVAERLTKNQICLIHAGRPEIGPRALGHRSIMMSAETVENRKYVSECIKQREWYRPVAPIMLQEDLSNYFNSGPVASPYMQFSYQALQSTKNEAPAVVHIDNTARVQTINKNDSLYLYDILSEYKTLTGSSILINTSLNLYGEPISNFLWETIRTARIAGLSSIPAGKIFVATDDLYDSPESAYGSS